MHQSCHWRSLNCMDKTYYDSNFNPFLCLIIVDFHQILAWWYSYNVYMVVRHELGYRKRWRRYIFSFFSGRFVPDLKNGEEYWTSFGLILLLIYLAQIVESKNFTLYILLEILQFKRCEVRGGGSYGWGSYGWGMC